MITHVVLFRLLPGVLAESPAVQAFHAAMCVLPRRIALIKAWHCGFNETPDAQAADYVLVAGFDNKDALYCYFDDPEHLAVLKLAEVCLELVFGDISV
jgi:hypothetical protein